MTATFSVLDTFIQNSNDIVNWSTIHDDEIFYKETVRRVPSAM